MSIFDKTGNLFAVRRLRSQLNALRTELEAAYAEIGKKCYMAFTTAEEPAGVDELCARITELNAGIARLNGEIDRLGNISRCPKCGYNGAHGVNFCANCGERLPEPPAHEEMPVSCPECGARRIGESRFCDNCGYSY